MESKAKAENRKWKIGSGVLLLGAIAKELDCGQRQVKGAQLKLAAA
jgi:hypothetical protein